ncbi:hypothetical protein CLOP_g2645, partial [Closterium sp. NIES-67]
SFPFILHFLHPPSNCVSMPFLSCL